ncbi:MAG TPA: hypothetical protein PKI03_27505 [Pseudomonadota bacterium]|nr:hypothetical protein [Pseudomonadota bacterium]
MDDFSEGEFAPLCVPVALWPAGAQSERGAPPYVRLATGISPLGVRLRSALPEELLGVPLRLRIDLPPPLPYMPDAATDGDGGWQGELVLRALPKEVVVRDEAGERAELRQLALHQLSKSQRELIERYASLRLLSDE